MEIEIYTFIIEVKSINYLNLKRVARLRIYIQQLVNLLFTASQ